jgi:NitT/TauT family transport system substrate-binding protein
MGLHDITLVDIRPQQFTDAIASSDIDALVSYEPYLTDIRGRMGDAIVEWPANSGQPVFGVLLARNDWIAGNPGTVERFVKSLDMAAENTSTHPAEARAIVQKRLNLSDAYLDSRWPDNQFSLSLDQSLVLATEDEARWMIANNLTGVRAVPDFGKYVYPDALATVRPGSVDITR